MIHYYKEDLPQDVLSILKADTSDPILTTQDFAFEPTKEQTTDLLNKMCQIGAVVIFESHNVVIILRRMNAYIGSFDTQLGEGATARDVIKAYKDFAEWLPSNTMYTRVESRTPLKRYAKVMTKAIGANIDGIMKQSYRTKDGNMLDEYIVGYNITRGISQCQ